MVMESAAVKTAAIIAVSAKAVAESKRKRYGREGIRTAVIGIVVVRIVGIVGIAGIVTGRRQVIVIGLRIGNDIDTGDRSGRGLNVGDGGLCHDSGGGLRG